MQPAGRRFPADVVVLRQEDEEVAAVRRNAGHGVRPASHGDAVVVARRHAVARVPLHVDAAEHGVDPRRQELVHRVAVLRRRYWQVELDGLRAREVLRRADAYVAGRPSEDLPLRSQVARLSVRLEVVGQYHVGVAPDVFVAGIARRDSGICWRCRCAGGEKCNCSRKRHESGASGAIRAQENHDKRISSYLASSIIAIMSDSRYAARKEWLAVLIRDAIVTADRFGDWTSSGFFEHNRRPQYGHRTVAQQQKQIEALTATLRKISERVALKRTCCANSGERRPVILASSSDVWTRGFDSLHPLVAKG